jgi:hypothetical protein
VGKIKNADLRDQQVAYLISRLQKAETALAGVWMLTIIPNTQDFKYCVSSYRNKFPDAINIWDGKVGEE